MSANSDPTGSKKAAAENISAAAEIFGFPPERQADD